MRTRRLLFLLLLFVPLLLPAQTKEKLERARREFAAGDYAATLRTLRSSKKLLRSDDDAALLEAVSLLYTGDLGTAEAKLLELNDRERGGVPIAWFYLGRVYHAQQLFTRAATEYKRYLRELPGEGPDRVRVTNLLRNVDNGIRAGFAVEGVLVENLGERVNSEYDEFGPIPSPTGSGRLYFTLSRPDLGTGQVHADVMVSEADQEGWGAPVSFGAFLNSTAEESLADMSANGQQLHYFRGDADGGGRFLVDTFRAEAGDKLVTLPSPAPLTTALGDASPFYGDPSGVFFASNRAGGYGGMDLYVMDRLPTGGFGPARNLGPRVNGPYDEVTPFVARDGRTLYYSTNDPEFSIGGFDVVRSFRVIGGEGSFVRPENVGLPVNSAGDDTHFRLAPDTFSAFLSSDRADGRGRRDLYIVYYVEPREEMRE